MYHRLPVHPRQADPPAVRPFAALPHDLAARSDLAPTDLAVLLALLFWARDRAECWPSDASIGRRIGRSEATVQRRLRHLESLGIIRRERTDRNPTGRIIRLAWREAPGEGPAPEAPPARRPEVPSLVIDPPPSPVRDEGNRVVGGEAIRRRTPDYDTTRSEALAPIDEPPPAESSTVGRIAPEAPETLDGPRLDAPRPPTPRRRPLPVLTVDDLARLAPSDPILARELARRTAPRPEPPPPPCSTAELIVRIRECPTYPPMLAQALALDLGDPGSFAGFHAVAQRAYRGEIDLDALADAHRQATGPAARNRGAIFMHAIKRIARSGSEHRGEFSGEHRPGTGPGW